VTGGGLQNGIHYQGNFASFEKFGNRHHVGKRTQHSGFDGRDRVGLQEQPKLSLQSGRWNRMDFMDEVGGFRNYRSYRGDSMDAEGRKGLQICLDARSATTVGPRNGERDGRRGHANKIRDYFTSPQASRSLARGGEHLNLSVVDPSFQELDGLSVLIDDVIYMPSLDHPDDRPHPFVYFINIKNESSERVCIRGRKWMVREDKTDEVIVVEGDGVVGQMPELEPGEEFSYNSYHVTRANGHAEGAFFGQTGNGRNFFVRIPRFKLQLPEWA
jgi:ApaG protein